MSNLSFLICRSCLRLCPPYCSARVPIKLPMRISIVTVVYNNRKQIEETINSVLYQTYPDIEYLVIDGGSTDGTVQVIKKYEQQIAYLVSESDNGIYDAMNKGAKRASGEVLGFLNSDDVYTSEHAIEKVADAFKDRQCEACFGDMLYFSPKRIKEVHRYWITGDYKRGAFQYGWVPPHPTFFLRKRILDRYGYFNLDFPISADFELILRLMEWPRQQN